MTTITTAIASIVAALAAKEPGSTELLTQRGTAAAEAATEVAAGEHKFLGRDEASRAAILTVWAFHESRWNACAVGDSGRSIGLMQVNRVWIGQKRASQVMCNAQAGMEEAIKILDVLTEKCGTPRRALTAYATGKCVSGKSVNAFVEHRWSQAGLNPTELDRPYTLTQQVTASN
ncbi:MAG: hypothetical protein EBT03_09880 [Betaproteobacteria bacterium]|nr:hypothetical protein [Betaproteobacteria bacterium]NCA17424.1 hypothetical protein [Betaproteobacteria bacterium]